MKTRHVILRGHGLATSLAPSAWQTFRALLDGRTIADRAASLPADIAPVDLVRAVGCAAYAQHAGGDPAVELAERAARDALTQAQLPESHWPNLDVYLGVSKGAMHDLTAAVALASNPAAASRPLTPNDPRWAMILGPTGHLSARLAQRLGTSLPTGMILACASGLAALDCARRQLLTDDAPPGRTALVVATEATLLPMFIHSYKRLGVLATLRPARYAGLPLDQRRHGFMLSEQAAAVVLESVETIPPGAIELADSAVLSEGAELIQPPPGMPALAEVGRRMLAPQPVDVVHPHATGTKEQDEAELLAYAPHLIHHPEFYAAKGALGHGLGAAGLVSLVIACLCAKADTRPPMPWLKKPIDVGIPIQTAVRDNHSPLRRHAVFAAGFGGHVAGAVIQKH